MEKLSHGALLVSIFALLIMLLRPWSCMVESKTTSFHTPHQAFALRGPGSELMGDRYDRRSPPPPRMHAHSQQQHGPHREFAGGRFREPPDSQGRPEQSPTTPENPPYSQSTPPKQSPTTPENPPYTDYTPPDQNSSTTPGNPTYTDYTPPDQSPTTPGNPTYTDYTPPDQSPTTPGNPPYSQRTPSEQSPTTRGNPPYIELTPPLQSPTPGLV